MAIYYRKIADHIIVSGKTYPYRDAIKAFGGRFQGAEKVWHLPVNESTLAEIHKLCKSVGGGPLASPEPSVQLKPDSVDEAINIPAFDGQAAVVSQISDQVAIVPANGLTISELMARIQLAITSAFPRSVWVLGELQNVGKRRAGIYFQLAESKDGSSEAATVTAYATLWHRTAVTLAAKHGQDTLDAMLQDGLKVRLLCGVGLYKDRGHITLNVLDIDPLYTKGALALARENLLKELRSKGLDQANKRLKLSPFPLKIGLISADGSRAKSDFLDQLFTYQFPGRVVFYPAQMQGEALLKEVSQGLKALANIGCDAIVVTRGGGSAADLRWFDSPEVAYAIVSTGVPVIAAIGHHDDVSVAEEICFQREKTPTAAADFLLQVIQQTKQGLEDRSRAMATLLTRKVDLLAKIQSSLSDRLRHATFTNIAVRSEGLGQLTARLESAFSHKILTVNRLLSALSMRLALQATNFIAGRSQFLEQTQTLLRRHADHSLVLNGNRLQKLLGYIERPFQQKALGFDHSLSQKMAQLAMAAQMRLDQAKQTEQHFADALRMVSDRVLANHDVALANLKIKIVSADPKPWQNKGWTRLLGQKGPIKSAKDLKRGESITARLGDAQIKMTVETIENTTKSRARLTKKESK